MSQLPQIKIELDAKLTPEENAALARALEAFKKKGILSFTFNAAATAAIATYAPSQKEVIDAIRQVPGVVKVSSFNPMSDRF